MSANPNFTQQYETFLGTGLPVTSDGVRRIIAEQAYYKAERRGFEPGFEEQDWIESERDVLTTRVYPRIENSEI